MGLKYYQTDNVHILKPAGKILGQSEAGIINSEINRIIDNNQNMQLNLVLDIEDVDWMNSSGLGILLSCNTTLKANKQGRMVMINLSERISNLLKITKLDKAFEIFPDKDKALEYLKSL